MFIETKWVETLEEWLRHNQTVENYEFYDYGDKNNISILELTFWGDKTIAEIQEVLDKLKLYECNKPELKKYKGCSIILKEYEFEALSEEVALDMLKERDLENNETVLIETLRDYVDKEHLTYLLECTFGIDVVSKIFRKDKINA